MTDDTKEIDNTDYVKELNDLLFTTKFFTEEEKDSDDHQDTYALVRQIRSLKDEKDLKYISSTCDAKINDMHRINLEKRMINALKKKYSTFSSLVKFANNLKINMYTTFKSSGNFMGGGLFKLTMCKLEHCADPSNCTHLEINGSFTKINDKSFNVQASYTITNDPRPETDIRYYMSESVVSSVGDLVIKVNKTNMLCGSGTSIYDCAVNDITDKLSLPQTELFVKSYALFGLVPRNENMLKSFLNDILTTITM